MSDGQDYSFKAVRRHLQQRTGPPRRRVRPDRNRQSVGVRSKLAVPAAARVLTGLDHDNDVVLVAAPDEQVLVVHPQQLVASLLADHYAGLVTGHADHR